MDWQLLLSTPPKLEFKQNPGSATYSDTQKNKLRKKQNSAKAPVCRVWTSHLGKTRVSTSATVPKPGVREDVRSEKTNLVEESSVEAPAETSIIPHSPAKKYTMQFIANLNLKLCSTQPVFRPSRDLNVQQQLQRLKELSTSAVLPVSTKSLPSHRQATEDDVSETGLNVSTTTERSRTALRNGAISVATRSTVQGSSSFEHVNRMDMHSPSPLSDDSSTVYQQVIPLTAVAELQQRCILSPWSEDINMGTLKVNSVRPVHHHHHHHQSVSQLRVMDGLQRLRQLQREGSRMVSMLQH
ncbi:hypothetical protein CEUSTIGMA_g10549.t1 [Chlamydomonas eustigma]|uniref:Uncharacterized protein n=1 Tax=Chlamydomonas eustigma TaxID=1157962 RepID=A0A250XJB1_9CHLO|nr:hypothetical protein CEUSTIGMA_g10549.t1 [Chlamydomonas eustigma]|eukprot:GAX83123.1 hypothetical protein CEUSTIGMA_g10549.t1 [Chlamydomonas eustigma]